VLYASFRISKKTGRAMGTQGNRSRRWSTAAGGLALVALLAIPASAAAGTKSKSATAAGDFAIASAKAKCPSGQRATGGGFTAPAFSFSEVLQVYESRKVGQRSWRASGQVLSTGSTAPLTLTAYAYCSSTALSTKTKSASVTVPGSSPIALSPVDAKCSSGKVQAGGFSGPPPDVGGFISNHAVTDSYRIDKKTWRSRIQSGGTPAAVTFTSYAYCSDEKKPAERSGSTTVQPNGALGSALSAECKHGTKPISGGFSQPGATTGPTGGSFTYEYESRRSGKLWRVSARHAGITASALNSIAYCT
jgi:hypothetical protein